MAKKNPENIMSGMRRGADSATAASALGATADKNEPFIVEETCEKNFL